MRALRLPLYVLALTILCAALLGVAIFPARAALRVPPALYARCADGVPCPFGLRLNETTLRSARRILSQSVPRATGINTRVVGEERFTLCFNRPRREVWSGCATAPTRYASNIITTFTVTPPDRQIAPAEALLAGHLALTFGQPTQVAVCLNRVPQATFLLANVYFHGGVRAHISGVANGVRDVGGSALWLDPHLVVSYVEFTLPASPDPATEETAPVHLFGSHPRTFC